MPDCVECVRCDLGLPVACALPAADRPGTHVLATAPVWWLQALGRGQWQPLQVPSSQQASLQAGLWADALDWEPGWVRVVVRVLQRPQGAQGNGAHAEAMLGTGRGMGARLGAMLQTHYGPLPPMATVASDELLPPTPPPAADMPLPEEELMRTAGSRGPGCVGLLGWAEGTWAWYVVQAYGPHTLHDAVKLSPALLATPTRQLFVLYQLLRALAPLHRQGLAHGAVRSTRVLVNQHLWVRLAGPATTALLGDCWVERPRRSGWGVFEDVGLLLAGWVRGEVGNLGYLLALNTLAGRRTGDPNFHPVVPWVVDFTRASSGWRDLTRTKYRLAKGDEQLDMAYEGSTPHHVTEMLSEITYHTYMARRTPVATLCRFVRARYEPHEYPSSMERMYQWTPDESIPEFYTDESVFQSLHDDMADLQVPGWCSSPRDFVEKHGRLLESDQVSARLHHWIDLTFGYRLSGRAAVKAKNVVLGLVDGHRRLTAHGMVQLFTSPHPQRLCGAPSGPSTALQNTHAPVPPAQPPSPPAAPDGHQPAGPARPPAPPGPRVDSSSSQAQPAPTPPGPSAGWGPALRLQQQEQLGLLAGRAGGSQGPEGGPLLGPEGDLFLLGVVGLELALADRMKGPLLWAPLGPPALQGASMVAACRPHLGLLPGGLRQAVLVLLGAAEPLDEPRTADTCLGSSSAAPPIVFPPYFPALYQLLAGLNGCSGAQQVGLAGEACGLLGVLDDEGVQLLLPALLAVATGPHASQAAPGLVLGMAAGLGDHRTRQQLVKPLFGLYERHTDPTLQVGLLGADFAVAALGHFGVGYFLAHFLAFYTDGLASPHPPVAQAAAAALCALVDALGPVVAARCMARPLLRRLGREGGPLAVQVLGLLGRGYGPVLACTVYVPRLAAMLARSDPTSQGRRLCAEAVQLLAAAAAPGQLAACVGLLASAIVQPVLQAMGWQGAVCEQAMLLLLDAADAAGTELARAAVGPCVEAFLAAGHDQRGATSGVHRAAQQVLGVDGVRGLMGDRQGRDMAVDQGTARGSAYSTRPAHVAADDGPMQAMAGAWERYLETQAQATGPGSSLVLPYRPVCNLLGHTGAIRGLAVGDGEGLLVSGSRDRTVRVWRLAGCRPGQASAQATYSAHRRPVVDVALLGGGLGASCDGGLQLWALATMQTLARHEPPRSHMGPLLPLPACRALAAGTADGAIRVFDVRTGAVCHEWRALLGPGSSIRSLAAHAGGSWLAAAFGAGHVGVLDMRTGLLLGAWRAHDADITHAGAVSEHQLATASSDHTLALWDVATGHRQNRIAGHGEAMACFDVWRRSVVTATPSGRLQLHPATDQHQGGERSVRLGAEGRGSVTGLRVLGLHGQAVVGWDTGQLQLLV